MKWDVADLKVELKLTEQTIHRYFIINYVCFIVIIGDPKRCYHCQDGSLAFLQVAAKYSQLIFEFICVFFSYSTLVVAELHFTNVDDVVGTIYQQIDLCPGILFGSGYLPGVSG